MFKPIKENTRDLSWSMSWSGWENFNPDFWAKAKYNLLGPKIISMALYSILLQTDNLLFPPLE